MYTQEKQVPLPRYMDRKIKMLREDFHIRLTKTEVAAIRGAQSEIEVDRIARDIIHRKL